MANLSLEGTLRRDDRKDGLEGLTARGHDPTFPHDGIVERDESRDLHGASTRQDRGNL